MRTTAQDCFDLRPVPYDHAKFRLNAHNKVNNLFYLHPRKCGGTSVHTCLKEMGVKFCRTQELHLDRETLELLNGDDRVIVFGHIDYLPPPKTDDQIKIMSDILKILYYKSDLIMPTRNPSNLLQSWMHYAKTRSNKILQDRDQNTRKVKGKDGGMLHKMSALKQNCLLFSEDGKTVTGKGRDYPHFKLKEEDEEFNLLALADFLKANEELTLSQLCSMQVELFRLDWEKLLGAYKSNRTVKIGNLPMKSSDRKILYYDCENIDSSHQYALDQMVRPGFSERLLNTRENVSESKSKKKGSDFDSVNRKLQNMIPAEWQIYAMSKMDI